MAQKFAFIGGGNMAQAIIGGLLKNGHLPDSIIVVEPCEGAQSKLKAMGLEPHTNIPDSIREVETVVLAVKPQIISEVATKLSEYLTGQTVLSIAAGIPLSLLTKMLDKPIPVVRAMPNTPALIQEGITGVYGVNVGLPQKKQINEILEAVGQVIWFDNEAALDAVTAISGSGPAYYFYVMEAMIKAAIDLGISSNEARSLVVQTAKGAALLADASLETPTQLRKNVTSPNGTTHAAIESMNSDQIDTYIGQAIKKAYDRSLELAIEANKKLSQY